MILVLVVTVLLVQQGGTKECGEQEIKQTRTNYEQCASSKISEISSSPEGEEDVVCLAVRQLIHECGSHLVNCFTEDQIEATKEKQRSGLQRLLAPRFTRDQLETCFSLLHLGENIKTSESDNSVERIESKKPDDVTDVEEVTKTIETPRGSIEVTGSSRRQLLLPDTTAVISPDISHIQTKTDTQSDVSDITSPSAQGSESTTEVSDSETKPPEMSDSSPHILSFIAGITELMQMTEIPPQPLKVSDAPPQLEEASDIPPQVLEISDTPPQVLEISDAPPQVLKISDAPPQVLKMSDTPPQLEEASDLPDIHIKPSELAGNISSSIMESDSTIAVMNTEPTEETDTTTALYPASYDNSQTDNTESDNEDKSPDITIPSDEEAESPDTTPKSDNKSKSSDTLPQSVPYKKTESPKIDNKTEPSDFLPSDTPVPVITPPVIQQTQYEADTKTSKPPQTHGGHFKCEEDEIEETKLNYDLCASQKIGQITSWLGSSGNKDDICSAVQELLFECGTELGWCFSEDQVVETRRKQRAGLESVLSGQFRGSLDTCFEQNVDTDKTGGNTVKTDGNTVKTDLEKAKKVVDTVKADGKTVTTDVPSLVKRLPDRKPKTLATKSGSNRELDGMSSSNRLSCNLEHVMLILILVVEGFLQT